MIQKIKTVYSLCKNEGARIILRRILRGQLHKIQRIVQKPQGTFGIQGDRVMRNIIQLIGEEYNITSVIETGTYKGHTTTLLANLFPALNVYSCELVMENYLEAKINTKTKPNIAIFNMTSPEFLKKIIKDGLAGETPLFFLDAHWLHYWPLEDELNIITSKLKSAIIIIDDFKIPDHQRFEYDNYKEKSCSTDLIKPALKKKNKYLLLLPKYNQKDAYNHDDPHHKWLVGHAIIFQNPPKTFSEQSKTFIDKYFEDKTELLTK